MLQECGVVPVGGIEMSSMFSCKEDRRFRGCGFVAFGLNDYMRPPATIGSVFPFDLSGRGGGRGGRGERGEVAGSGSGDDSIRGVST